MDEILPEVHVGVFKERALGAKHIFSFSKTHIFAKSFNVFFLTDSKSGLFQGQIIPGFFLGIFPLCFYMSILLPLLRGRKCPPSETQSLSTHSGLQAMQQAGRKRP